MLEMHMLKDIRHLRAYLAFKYWGRER